jgi:putative hydroxymethylpyrimidine transport system permease protein
MSADASIRAETGAGTTAATPPPARRRQRRTRRLATFAPPALLLLILFGTWEVVARTGHVQDYILPAPDKILSTLWESWGDVLASATRVTVKEMFLGFFIAVVCGLGAAVAMKQSQIVRRALYPLLIASQTIPIVVLAPILAIIMGYNIGPKLVIVSLVCFFPIAVTTFDGLRAVDEDLVRMMRTLHGTRAKTFWRVELPSAMPSFFSSLRVAAAFAPVGAVFGEFSGSNDGLGFVMLQAAPQLQTALVFAAVLILTIMSVALVGIVSVAERLIAPWARQPRRNA